jgi:AraC-like DNA-binding protein
MDPLSDVLRSVRLKGGVFLDVRFTEPWCVYSQVIAEDCRPILENPSQMISYHFMTEGSMLASVDGSPPIVVEAGEIVLLPRNDKHMLASAPGLRPLEGRDLVQPSPDGGLARIFHGGGGRPARIVCGFLGCEEGFNPLIATLPRIIKINIRTGASRGMIEASLDFAVNELAQGRVAGSGILARLSELLFVEAVRNYAETRAGTGTGWLKGLSDPQIGQALAAIHRDIAKPWKAEDLAKQAAMSRSAFMSRFTQLVGASPIRYLTTWRLNTAKLKLSETSKAVARIAYEVGYESEDSFSRAFKREFGASPARWRSGELPVAGQQ